MNADESRGIHRTVRGRMVVNGQELAGMVDVRATETVRVEEVRDWGGEHVEDAVTAPPEYDIEVCFRTEARSDELFEFLLNGDWIGTGMLVPIEADSP